MAQPKFRKKVERLLASADIQIDGNRPWDIQVHNQDLYSRLLAKGSLGLGESYQEGWWDCDRLDEFFHRILRARLNTSIRTTIEFFEVLQSKLLNLQKPSRAFEVGQRHYDIGNNLFQHMLDKRLIYSCGYWKDASTLDEAQEAKLDLICRKLDLQPGMRVLDIGCGWGGAARYVAEQYQVEVVGIVVSEEQAKFGQSYCQGLPVEIRLQDYRDLTDKFDRIFSLGMIEHVGYKNYRTFFQTVKRCLQEDGLFLLHTIGSNRSVTRTDPWLSRYIFPNSMLPSARQICTNIEGLFVLEDWHNFGADYDRTLMHWHQNFLENWEAIQPDYDENFYRTWIYYLLSCAGSFRARHNQLWQIVLSANGNPGVYPSVR
ncbi:MAG: cyclopropane fatty acyl phospholipid synthase [Desulfohalobiaceae bacterium]|nr:cyclopropane fatty acyl phospholipid synthase [Desulfohalobiaceae bacterium]